MPKVSVLIEKLVRDGMDRGGEEFFKKVLLTSVAKTKTRIWFERDDFEALGIYVVSPPRIEAPAEGPGTELKALLKDWLGIESSPTCKCNAMAARMNIWGCDECRKPENMQQVINVMRDEHGRRVKAGQTILPWSEVAAKTIVNIAIRRAKAKQVISTAHTG